MRFFTPELYIQFNSSDDEVADLANDAWENAVQKYQRHLENIRPRMPPQVRKVADLCLHDYEVLGFQQEFQSASPLPEPFWPAPFWSAVAIMFLKREQTLRFLIYVLWDRVREHEAKKDWPFAAERKHWLYDEVDIEADQRGLFLHRVLFSDGMVVEIPFATAITTSLTLPASSEESATRRIA